MPRPISRLFTAASFYLKRFESQRRRRRVVHKLRKFNPVSFCERPSTARHSEFRFKLKLVDRYSDAVLSSGLLHF